MMDKSADYGFTEFSDITPEEFEAQYLTMHLQETIKLEATAEQENLSKSKKKPDTSRLPKHFDWREKGVISKVKEQSTCGSCWTFATTGVIEAQYAIQTGKLVEFSEQMLLDCDGRNDGCSGGLMHKAYKSIREWGGLELAESYGKYQNAKHTCHKSPENFVATVPTYFMSEKDESYIMHYLVNHGPLAAGVNARYLQFYKKGVHSHQSCNDDINHAIMIVGYGTEDGNDYWIVKNTWGEKWGEKGYFKLLRGNGHCGIHTYVSAPHVDVIKK